MALSEQNRLRADRDIRTTLKQGKTVHGSFFMLKSQSNGAKSFRGAVVISSGIVRTAVQRNRIRRVVTELMRDVLQQHSIDVVCVIRRAVDLDETQRKEIVTALKRL